MRPTSAPAPQMMAARGLLLLAGLAAWLAPLRLAAPDTFVLYQTDFLVRSTVRVVNNGAVKLEQTISELYSDEIGRGRLSKAGLEYFRDKKTDVVLQHAPDTNTCSKVDLKDIDHELGLGSLNEMLQDLGLADDPESHAVPSYVFGPSRLLFLVASKASLLKEPTGDQKGSQNTVLGRSCRVLEMNNNKGIIRVYYELNTPNELLPKSALPVSVRLSSTRGEAVTVDFGSIRWGPNVAISSSSSSAFGLERSKDPLTFPLASGCTTLIRNSLEELYEKMVPERTQISFRALGRASPNSALTSFFVAMDGTSFQLRIDSQPTSFGAASTSVLNLNSNRKYIATRDLNQKVKKDLADDQESPEERSCMVTRIGTSKVEIRNYMSIGAFVLGSPAFVFMGFGRVRGVRVRIYESVQSTHPAWLDQSLLYKDKSGRYLTRWILDSDVEKKLTDFTTVVYMDELELNTGSKIARPLRLEIYQASKPDSEASSDTRLMAFAQIHDFRMNLATAPDGSTPADMFSLPHLCSDMYDRYAEVSMDLSVLEPPGYDVADKYSYLENTEARHQAVMRIMARSTQLPAPMIYGLTSQLIEAGVRPLVHVNFRVAEHPRNLYDLQFIGNGRSLNQATISGWATSLEHCLHWIGSSKRSTHVYIILTGSICELDTKTPELTEPNSVPSSQAFVLEDEGLSQVFLVTSKPDDEMAREHGWLSQLCTTQFNAIALSTYPPNTDPTNIGYVRPSNFKARNVHVVTHNFQADRNHSGPVDSVVSLPNFKLVAGLDKVSARGSVAGQVMTLSRCQQACLADSECKSYSFCSAWPDFECLLSGSVRLTRDLVSGAPKRAPKHGDRLSLDPNDSQSATGPLIRDPRCNTYNKKYVNQFTRSWYKTIMLSQYEINRVDSMDECAQKCFEDNSRTFQQDIQAAVKLGATLTAEETADTKSHKYLSELENLHRSNRQRFCSGFAYIPTPFSDDVKDGLNDYLTNEGSDKALCLTSRPFDSQITVRSNEYIEAENYEYSYSELFDMTGSQGLLGSASPEGRAAKIPNMQRSSYYSTVEQCSRDCVLQKTGLVPACRSFDAISRTEQPGFECIFNSRTYTDLSQHLGANFTWSSERRHVQHFEPLAGIVAEELQLGAAWSGPGSGWESHPSSLAMPGPKHGLASMLNVLFSLLLVAAALVLGVYLGAHLNTRLADLIGPHSQFAPNIMDISLINAEHNGPQP